MLLCLVLFVMGAQSWALSTQCDRSTSMKYSVSTWRNETGHRLVAADMQSDASRKNSISLAVELVSEKCGDSKSVILKTLSSTGQPEEQASVRSTVAPRHPEEQASVSTMVAPTVLPLPGYRHIPGFGYYKLLPNEMNWEDGVEACRKEGTHMLLVETQEEIDVITEKSRCCPWVGVHRESSSGPWINVLGQQMYWTDFFGWLPGYPERRGDCIRVSSTSSRKGTQNTECHYSRLVVCEQM